MKLIFHKEMFFRRLLCIFKCNNVGFISDGNWLVHSKIWRCKIDCLCDVDFLLLCVLFIHFSIVGKTDLFNLPWQVYGLGLLIAVFATVIPSFFVSASIKMINSSNFAIVGGIGPISSIIVASIFLNERFHSFNSLEPF